MAGRASSSITYRWTYDVFLSFRGVDTRYGFTGNLYNGLCNRGIRTFIDDRELQQGEELSLSLVKAIQESRIALVIFSKNYAFSSFCLDELTMILECSDKNGSLVLPVFYGVDPSDVRHQRGSYGEALARYEERFKDYKEKVEKWRMALHHAANLGGYHFLPWGGYEYEFIGKIIKMVSSKIEHSTSHVADYPVGLESRVLEVKSLLDVGSDDVVHMVGIYGIGGIGKTTIALAIYNYIGDQFEASCFLADVRENSNKHGLVHLQEIVLSEILGDKDINLQSVSQGILTISQRLRRKKVLLVLDDVDKLEQLQAIVGSPDWFGSGSIVIVTTRNKQLLAIHGIKRTYEVAVLREARDLLCWNAFKTDKVDPSYARILEHTVTYASRLPLALEVIGSNLYGKSIEEWKSALDLYKKIPDINVQEILKVSFDSLEEDEKAIFLDIACFFNGHKLADVEDILSAHHGLSMKFIIVGLIEKSLVKIDDGLVTLHDLIQDMGREIVRQESPKDPGKRSRLWFSEDIARVLENNLGSSTIESLFLDFSKDEGCSNEPKGEEINWDGEALKKMESLKTLIIRNGRFNKGPTHLPHSLRVLKWSGYPSPSLPSDFHPKKLSILELPESCLRTSEQIQRFVCLTVLDFGYCYSITCIPDVSGLPNLEKLSFKHCENLSQIHKSVGFLDKLRILDAVRCKKLRSFPPIRMTSLEQLNLSHCSILESFPEILGKMENITELHITGSPIKELPSSIQNLTRLRKLELQLCGMVQLPSSIVLLPELGLMCVSQCEALLLSKVDKYEELESKSSNTQCLILSHCNISEDFLPIGLTWFANVKDLNLSGNSITFLHPCIKECHSLRNLKLDDCIFLGEIRGIPMKLETLSAKGCTSLKCLDLTYLPAPACDGESLFLKELILDECVYLQEIRGVLLNLDHLSAKNCISLVSRCTNMLLNQKSVETGNKMFSLPGTKIPEWFTYHTSGESISFWFCNKFPAISLCLVIRLVDEQPTTVKFSPRVFIDGNKQFLGNGKVFEFGIATDHIFLSDIQLLKFEDNMDEVLSDNKWHHVEVSYEDHITNHEVPIRQVAKYNGVHLCKHTSSIVQFTNPLQTKINEPLGLNSMEGPRKRVKPSPSEAEKGLAPQQTPLVEMHQEDFGGEISQRLPQDEVHPTIAQNDPPVMERYHECDDVGFHFNHGGGCKHGFIGRLIKEISSKINRVPLYVADYPVGLESRVHKVMLLLDVGSNDVVRMVGIHGIGGIGKTTIALAVYNSIIDQFEASCFLLDVRESSNKHGLIHLQKILFSEILGDKDINLQSVSEEILIIRQRLKRRKVLLVLDDVDNIEQLLVIVGGPDWYGPGSRVVVTTRDKHLLAFHGIERTYDVEELSEREALDLLCWNAFKTDEVDPCYEDVLKHAVIYASGLPLALQVLGSNLFGKSVQEWVNALDMYKKIPDTTIQEKLKLSFDSLEEEEKEVFLDIACFFNRHKLSCVEDILYAHRGLSVKCSIEMLIEKSLIKIDDGLVTLHDLIQDMGREIVRQESPNEPGKRSRLWFFRDVVQILENNTGSSKIESLFLGIPKDEVHSNGLEVEEIHWDGEALKKMENLKTLIIENGHFNKGPTHLPHSLRVLKWCGYPSPSLPSDFHPRKLAILMLPDSCLGISEQIQGFMCLTVLDFSYCEYILRIPDVSGIPNLTKLSFKHCRNLIQIHESVGFLDKLRILDSVGCAKLRTFPPIRLSSLEQLNLSHCSYLENFPEILGKMENITELHITGSPIKELPFSIQNLTQLQKLELQICGMLQLPRSIVMLPKLGLMCVSRCEGLQLSKLDKGEELESKSSNMECLILSHCRIWDDILPIGLTWFANVKDLNLSGNNFTFLHACLKECHFLRNLKLDDCRSLREIRGIPAKLETLSMKGCMSLKYLDLAVLHAGIGEYHSLKELILDGCVYLQEIMGLLPKLDRFSAESVEAGNKFILPGTRIPEWFTHHSRGGSMSCWFRNKFPVISVCFVIGLVDEQSTLVKFSPIVFINGNKQISSSQKVYEFRIVTDHIFLFDLQLLNFEDNKMDVEFSENDWNHVEVSYDRIAKDEVVKQIGIHLFNKTSSMEDIRFTIPYCKKRKSPLYCKERKLDDFFSTRESLEGSRQRVKTTAARTPKALAMVPYAPILTLTDPPHATAEKGEASLPTPSFVRPWNENSGEIVKGVQEDEVHPNASQHDLPDNEDDIASYDVRQKAMSFCTIESVESSSNSYSSDSDDPFDQVNVELSVGRKQIICYGESSGDASLTSIREALDSFELVMVKDIAEISSDPAAQSQLDQLLDLLSTSSHPQVTLEVKEALVEFRRRAFLSFQEFQATVESVNKLKGFEKQKARILNETVAGKERRKDLKYSIKKVSLAIKTENSRKMELEAEIATLRKQLATKEMDLQQIVSNVKNQEAKLSTYLTNCDALDEQARSLAKEATDLLAANRGVEDECEAAEINQNRLKSTWSTDLTSQFIRIRKNILGHYE